MSEDLLSHDLKKSNKAVLLEKAMAMQKLLKEKSCEHAKTTLNSRTSNIMAEILSRI